jgi:hypothetical protein
MVQKSTELAIGQIHGGVISLMVFLTLVEGHVVYVKQKMVMNTIRIID